MFGNFSSILFMKGTVSELATRAGDKFVISLHITVIRYRFFGWRLKGHKKIAGFGSVPKCHEIRNIVCNGNDIPLYRKRYTIFSSVTVTK
jgi:hypothetical protein